MTTKSSITIAVNGKQHQAEIEPRMLLVHYLREALDLTGTHIGCNTSQCGACVVLLNGEAVECCTLLAVQADNSEVTTMKDWHQKVAFILFKKVSGKNMACNVVSAHLE